MKPVMLATDGSPTAGKATATAIELAKLLDTKLVIATAWDIPSSTVGYAAIPVSAELAKLGQEQAEKAAAEAAAGAKGAGIEAQTVVLRGFPVEEICLAAEKYEPRLLVVGSHGWGTMRRMFFGSVSTGRAPSRVVPSPRRPRRTGRSRTCRGADPRGSASVRPLPGRTFHRPV